MKSPSEESPSSTSQSTDNDFYSTTSGRRTTYPSDMSIRSVASDTHSIASKNADVYILLFKINYVLFLY